MANCGRVRLQYENLLGIFGKGFAHSMGRVLGRITSV